jgi:hypothetical protein
MMSDKVRKCLRQQSKDFYAASFDALVKWWDNCNNLRFEVFTAVTMKRVVFWDVAPFFNCNNVGGGYVE